MKMSVMWKRTWWLSILFAGLAACSAPIDAGVPDDGSPSTATGTLIVQVQPMDATVEIRRVGAATVHRRVAAGSSVRLEVGAYEVAGMANGYERSAWRPVDIEEDVSSTVSLVLYPEVVVLPPALVDVTSVLASAPNYVGGVDITISFRSQAKQIIDYVRFRAAAYNAVGDVVYDDFDRPIYLGYTGPVHSGSPHSGTWDAVIYNWSAECFVLTEVEVELRDDTIVTYSSAEELNSVVSAPNKCLPRD